MKAKQLVGVAGLALLLLAAWQQYGSQIAPWLPVVGEPERVLILSEAQDRTPQEATLLVEFRKWADAQGLEVLIVDPDSNLEGLEFYKGRQSLPAVFVIGKGGQLIHEGELPESLDGLQRLVQ